MTCAVSAAVVTPRSAGAGRIGQGAGSVRRKWRAVDSSKGCCTRKPTVVAALESDPASAPPPPYSLLSVPVYSLASVPAPVDSTHLHWPLLSPPTVGNDTSTDTGADSTLQGTRSGDGVGASASATTSAARPSMNITTYCCPVTIKPTRRMAGPHTSRAHPLQFHCQRHVTRFVSAKSQQTNQYPSGKGWHILVPKDACPQWCTS